MELPLILEQAFEQWEIQTKIPVHWAKTDAQDVDIEMEFSYNEEKHRVFIDYKKELRNYQIQELKMLAQKHHPLMIVAENIFPKIKEGLREAGIAYLETNGNIYYKDKNLFLWLDGKKPVKREEQKSGRAFTKTGLKVVFHFLLQPEWVNLTYRQIADKTGVNFGNINFIMTDLKEQSYLLKIDKDNFKLINKKELLTKWMDGYEHKLKPSLLIGAFHFLKEEDALHWKRIPLRNMKTWWGRRTWRRFVY